MPRGTSVARTSWADWVGRTRNAQRRRSAPAAALTDCPTPRTPIRQRLPFEVARRAIALMSDPAVAVRKSTSFGWIVLKRKSASLGARSGIRRLGVERQPQMRDKANRERRDPQRSAPRQFEAKVPRPLHRRRARPSRHAATQSQSTRQMRTKLDCRETERWEAIHRSRRRYHETRHRWAAVHAGEMRTVPVWDSRSARENA